MDAMEQAAASARRRRAFQAGRLRRECIGQNPWGPVWKYTPVKFFCAVCGVEFVPRRKTARYCSTRCRVAAHRARKG
jgi:hypothetical protein